MFRVKHFVILLFLLPSIAIAECTLTWASVTDADDYDIYYGATQETVSFDSTVSGTTVTCTTMSITPTDGYWFAIESSNTGGNSAKRYARWRKPFSILDYTYE